LISTVPGKFYRLGLKLRRAVGLSGPGKLAHASTMARESKLASAGKLATAGNVASAGTTAGAGTMAGIIGIGSKLFKFLVLVLPIGAVLFGVLLIAGMIGAVAERIVSIGRNVWRWIVTESVLSLLVLASVLLLGFTGWTAYDHLQERRIFVAAGSRTAESYTLAEAMKTVTERHYPRIRLVLLEIEAAPGDAGMLEKDIVQLATVPGDLPAGPSARSVALLAGSPQRVLLARKDVDEQVVYALTQVLTQFSGELAAAIPAGRVEPQNVASLLATIRKPVANGQSNAPLHPGAAAFYDRDKTLFIFRYARLSALVAAGLVLLGIWIWHLRRRTQPKQIIQPVIFSPPAEREPWTFSKILLESAGENSAPIRRASFLPSTSRDDIPAQYDR